jgi:nitrite reductase/ring-hydroxylating ferredoxin subunit
MSVGSNDRKWHSQYPELGTNPVPIEPYISPEFFELERDRVFRRVWLCLGREERIPNPGDFFVKDLAIARTSIIVVRGKDGRIRAFHNACSHRSNRVEWQMKGCAATFTCPFHGWSYGLDGRVLAIPDENNFFNLDKKRLGLTPITLDTWQGFIFISLNPEQPLREYLGEWADALEGYPFAGNGRPATSGAPNYAAIGSCSVMPSRRPITWRSCIGVPRAIRTPVAKIPSATRYILNSSRSIKDGRCRPTPNISHRHSKRSPTVTLHS